MFVCDSDANIMFVMLTLCSFHTCVCYAPRSVVQIQAYMSIILHIIDVHQPVFLCVPVHAFFPLLLCNSSLFESKMLMTK